MTDEEKLAIIKTLLEDGSGYMPSDETLNAYIALSKSEILAWMYHLIGGVPEDVTENVTIRIRDDCRAFNPKKMVRNLQSRRRN